MALFNDIPMVGAFFYDIPGSPEVRSEVLSGVRSEVESFRSFRAGSQVFTLLMLFLFVILHTMSSGKILQLLCIFPFGLLCLTAISMMVVEILLAVCILVGTVV